MINIFQSQFAPQDKSLVFLNQLFGSMNGIIYNQTDSGQQYTIGLLGTMFKTFNTVILAVAVLIVIYVTIVSVMATAHEGEFMGKKYGGIWTPIRMVLGIAALVPTGSGYSAIQMIMMWVIVQGIGAADLLWTTAINYINATGSATAQINIPTVNVASQMGNLFQSLTCDATARLKAQAPGGSSGYYCHDKTCSSTPFTTDTQTPYNIGPDGQGNCGQLTFCDVNTVCASTNNDPSAAVQCAVCKSQVNALQAIIPTLSGIGALFASADYDYRDFYYNSANGKPAKDADWGWINTYCSNNNITGGCCVPSKSPNAQQIRSCDSRLSDLLPDQSISDNANANTATIGSLYWPYAIRPKLGDVNFINVAVNYYMEQITDAVTSAIAALPPPTSGGLFDAQKTGWIYAGAYYYTLVRGNSNTLQAAMPPFGVSAMSADAMKKYRNNYSAASALEALLPGGGASGGSGDTGNNNTASASSSCTLPKALCPLMSPINTIVQNAQKAFTDNITPPGASSSSGANPSAFTTTGGGGRNPLLKLSIAGQTLLAVGQSGFIILVGVNFLIGGVLGVNGFVLGTGAIDPFLFAGAFAYLLIGPLIIALLGLLVVYGGILGVYVPLIPLVIFTLGALGWFISAIEAMVAGPIAALGILSPNSQGHEILGKAEHGLLLLFNIFLRPSLMVFGLMAAMLLASIILSIINYAFWAIFFESLPSTSILMLFFYLFAYVTLVVTAMNKCFQLIAFLPERVIRWIGGHGEHGFEAEGVSDLKGATSETSGRAEKTGAGGENAGRSAADGKTQIDAKKNKAAATFTENGGKKDGDA